MKNNFFVTSAFLLFSSAFAIAQTAATHRFHFDKAPNDTIHRADVKKNLELKADSASVKVASFSLDVTYTTYVFSENSTTNKITKNMVDIIKYLKGVNNFCTIKNIVTLEGGTTATYEGFKLYVVD